jgi:hypothetical protein
MLVAFDGVDEWLTASSELQGPQPDHNGHAALPLPKATRSRLGQLMTPKTMICVPCVRPGASGASENTSDDDRCARVSTCSLDALRSDGLWREEKPDTIRCRITTDRSGRMTMRLSHSVSRVTNANDQSKLFSRACSAPRRTWTCGGCLNCSAASSGSVAVDRHSIPLPACRRPGQAPRRSRACHSKTGTFAGGADVALEVYFQRE